MKPDNETQFPHSTFVCKHDSKPLEHNNGTFDTSGLEEIMKENQNAILCDLNDRAYDAASLASEINGKDGFLNKPEIDFNMVAEDNSNGNENEVKDENEVRDSVAPCTFPSRENESFEKNTDLYTDKNVMQCEPPELLVCYNENSYHVIKDICIDEGVTFKDNILTESENGEGLCSILPDENRNGGTIKEREGVELLSPNESNSSSENDHDEDDAHGFMTKEELDIEMVIADSLKSLLENHFDDDSGNDGGSLAQVQTGEANYNATDKIVNDDDIFREKFVETNMPLLQKFSKPQSLESLDHDSHQVEQQSDQIPYSEAKYESSAMVSATEEESNKIPPINDLSYNSKVESATIIFDFISSNSAASDRGKNPDGVDHLAVGSEPPLEIESELRHDGGASHSLVVESEVQHGQGESSFSMAGHVSGLITYSGPVAHSGNVSLRSDSSTTSTRSFAFPVLQSEWNSSPVRMAKADRRHYRKHRGWRQGLFCCGF